MGHGDIHILQIDAHLDFVDQRHGVRFGATAILAAQVVLNFLGFIFHARGAG